MKFFAPCMLLIVSCFINGSAQQSRCNGNCVQTVRGLLDASYRGFSTGWTEKQNHRLGDRVGVAIQQIYKGRSLYSADHIRTFLPVIEEAFKYPNLIENPEDKTPNVSLALLLRLRNRVKDHFLNMEITKTLNAIQFGTKETSQ
jgi:hypothetical protein